MLLALDTSTNTASIALVHEERLVGELTWDVGQRHSAELLQRLNQRRRRHNPHVVRQTHRTPFPTKKPIDRHLVQPRQI